jgi:hypothetical protein
LAGVFANVAKIAPEAINVRRSIGSAIALLVPTLIALLCYSFLTKHPSHCLSSTQLARPLWSAANEIEAATATLRAGLRDLEGENARLGGEKVSL